MTKYAELHNIAFKDLTCPTLIEWIMFGLLSTQSNKI